VETVSYEARDGVGWVTLNRPEVMNAFDARMLDELSALWRQLRTDDDVRVIVLTGAGDRAFCTGLDRTSIVGDGTADGGIGFTSSPFHQDDPGARLGPKTNDLWKPVIGAVNGMACGGAFYLLGECDILIAAEEATFFDPHVTYGMPATYESILLVGRMPLGEVLRMQLTGANERLSTHRVAGSGRTTRSVDRYVADCCRAGNPEGDLDGLRTRSSSRARPGLRVRLPRHRPRAVARRPRPVQRRHPQTMAPPLSDRVRFAT
jgi:enoyl-CoA hydratase/carnithine racemase